MSLSHILLLSETNFCVVSCFCILVDKCYVWLFGGYKSVSKKKRILLYKLSLQATALVLKITLNWELVGYL
jgi:hypothetical protein